MLYSIISADHWVTYRWEWWVCSLQASQIFHVISGHCWLETNIILRFTKEESLFVSLPNWNLFLQITILIKQNLNTENVCAERLAVCRILRDFPENCNEDTTNFLSSMLFGGEVFPPTHTPTHFWCLGGEIPNIRFFHPSSHYHLAKNLPFFQARICTVKWNGTKYYCSKRGIVFLNSPPLELSSYLLVSYRPLEGSRIYHLLLAGRNLKRCLPWASVDGFVPKSHDAHYYFYCENFLLPYLIGQLDTHTHAAWLAWMAGQAHTGTCAQLD